MNHFHNCCCDECERLDRLPVHRHGIPHAKQTTFLGAVDGSAPPAQIAYRQAAAWESLPLFAGDLQPTLF